LVVLAEGTKKLIPPVMLGVGVARVPAWRPPITSDCSSSRRQRLVFSVCWRFISPLPYSWLGVTSPCIVTMDDLAECW
jgi:hypothetical protein